MKEKLIKILTVASLSVASLAAVVGVAISHGMKSLSSINADDTRYIEIKAEDIRDAIGGGTEGTFTIAGIGFHVNNASYSEGKANINGGILETTVTAGQSVNPENNMMGNGYQSMAILDKESASGGNLMTKDDSKNVIAEHPFGAETQALYELDFSADNLTKKVSNLFVAFGAGGGTSFSSIKFFYTCKEAPTSHTVTFMNGEDVYDTQEVEDGDLAVAPATDPTKDPDVSAPKYRFKGWDRDLSTPITDDTVINAEYAVYTFKDVVDDFEDYDDSSELKDEGWKLEQYNSGWVDPTSGAALGLSANSEEGQQSLVLNTWAHNVGYRFTKTWNTPLTKSANAIRFRMMAPSFTTARVTLGTRTIPVPLAGDMKVTFTQQFALTSSDYVEYTIPFNSDKWYAWNDPTKGTLASLAEGMGMCEDDITTLLESVSFFVTANKDNKEMKVFVDSISFVTIDPVEFSELEQLGLKKTYTGKTLSDNVIRIDVNNDLSATATVIDMETPLAIPGHLDVTDLATGGREAIFTSDDGTTLTYTGRVTNHGNKIEFTSATGALAANVQNMTLDAVQVVNDFEQYSGNGTGYYYGGDGSGRSGLRGDFFFDYYKENDTTRPDPSPWNTSDPNWHLSTEAMNLLGLKNDGGQHGGSKYAYVQSDGYGRTFRYFTYGLFDGTSEKNAFRGTTFSFWAKTKASGTIPQLTVRAYARSYPNRNGLDEYAAKAVYDSVLHSEWQRYEIELNPNFVYYGFMISVKGNWTNNSAWLYLDDIEVFTANPYAKYVAPEAPTLQAGMTYQGRWNGQRAVNIEIIDDENAKISMPAEDLTVNGTYVRDNEDNVSFTFEDSSTLDVKVIDDEKTLQFVAATGNSLTIGQYLYGIDYHMLNYAENAETYEDSGKMYYQGNTNKANRSGARGAFYCEYEGGTESQSSEVGGKKWILMGGEGNQLSLDDTLSVDGGKSLKMRYSSAGAMRYMQWELYEGSAVAKTGFNKFGFYINNTTGSATTVNVSVYKASKVYTENVGDNTKRAMTGQFSLPASSGWVFKTIDLDPSLNYYGFAVWFAKHGSTAGFVNFDKAFFYNDYESPENYYFGSSGSVLEGTIKVGAASLEIKDNGVMDLTCENLGGTISGTYSMVMDGTTQMMTITVNDGGISGTITGEYSADLSGHISFTVTSVTGDFSAAIDPGTGFAS